MAARFLKIGANDFITKQTFLTEEFYCRVTQNIENLERIHLIREASIKDALTGLYNRRYFFETGNKLFANAIRENLTITCGMIDIDHFKNVNDTYGHEAGDKTLVHISSILNHRMRNTDIVARLGGEEFCVLAINMRKEYAKKVFEELRVKVEKSSIEIEDEGKIHITVSMGVVTELADSLEDMVKKADKLLYEAKESGRNRVITSGN
jgi:diguanylate cyclase (GGDEF)-like protein